MGSCVSSEIQMKPNETPTEFMIRRQYARYAAMNDTDKYMYQLHMNTTIIEPTWLQAY